MLAFCCSKTGLNIPTHRCISELVEVADSHSFLRQRNDLLPL